MEKEQFNEAFGKITSLKNPRLGEYFSFIPNKLPPKVEFDKKLALALSKADSTLSELSGVGLIIPNPDLLVAPYLKKEALSSSRIEGTRISLSEFFQLEAKDGEEKDEEGSEVANYIKSLNYGLKRIKEENISSELIRNMHKILMENVRGMDLMPGLYRPEQNWVGPAGSTIQEATFVPPPVDKVELLLEELYEYLNTYDEMPLLIKCALMHYQFETIHPFCDGNGRMGRSLITLYLVKKSKISKPLLYLSYFFEKHRDEYVELLLEANKTGKFEKWILFFLQAVKEQSEDALERAIKITKKREEFLERIQDKKILNGIRVIDILFSNPFIQINKLAEQINTTYPTAKLIIDKLIKLGILSEVNNKKRGKLFYSKEILEIIDL